MVHHRLCGQLWGKGKEVPDGREPLFTTPVPLWLYVFIGRYFVNVTFNLRQWVAGRQAFSSNRSGFLWKGMFTGPRSLLGTEAPGLPAQTQQEHLHSPESKLYGCHLSGAFFGWEERCFIILWSNQPQISQCQSSLDMSRHDSPCSLHDTVHAVEPLEVSLLLPSFLFNLL